MRIITLTQIDIEEDMFDEFVDTQTEVAEEIEQTFSVAGFNSVTILNTYGIEASLTVDGETQTVSLLRDSITDWWDYWFAPSRPGRDMVFYFPLQSSGDATLTISYPGGTAKCGMCITGVARELMFTRPNVTMGIDDYSRVLTNEFGQTYLNPGRWAKRVQADLLVQNTNMDLVYREIVKNRATPCVFDYNEYPYDLTEYHTSIEGIQNLILYGYTEDFNIKLHEYSYKEVTHEAQGLV